jgi:hypothetical protein
MIKRTLIGSCEDMHQIGNETLRVGRISKGSTSVDNAQLGRNGDTSK